MLNMWLFPIDANAKATFTGSMGSVRHVKMELAQEHGTRRYRELLLWEKRNPQ